MVAIDDILGEEPVPVDYGKVPWGIYCRPRSRSPATPRRTAKEAGYDVVTSKHRYSANSRAKIIGETEGLVKVIAEKGPDGGPARSSASTWWARGSPSSSARVPGVNWEATVDEVAAFIQPHPTLSELFGDTVQDLTGRRLH
jgi:dihydrolipoamide dehydrogenase